ncbi:hypothetical protein [Candidatus Hodgkinia cicadicola]
MVIPMGKLLWLQEDCGLITTLLEIGLTSKKDKWYLIRYVLYI